MNWATLWVLLKTQKFAALLILTGFALFGGGWHLGRVMSPYYASHPIVFEDRVGESDEFGENGSLEALAALRSEGQGSAPTIAAEGASASEQAPIIGHATPTPSPVVAGTQEVVSPEVGESLRQFVASVNSDLYHHVDCSSWKRIKEENQVWFSSAAEAAAAGYKPSQCTQETVSGL